MIGHRFYEEFTSKRKRVSAGNVFALCIPTAEPRDVASYMRRNPGGVGALFDEPDSAVCYTGCSWEWLRTKCVRVSERRAREIHPRLFAYLEPGR